MCGLIGIIAPNRPVELDWLERALDALQPRGRDGKGSFISEDRRIALGHTRLAIRDIPAGAQPLWDARRELGVALNGEIYDVHASRRRLEGRGQRFRTRCDAELLLALYGEDPAAFGARLAELEGEFAVLIVDLRAHRLVAARSAEGSRSLLVGQHGGVTRVASTARALFAAGHPPSWDEEALGMAAALQYAPPAGSGRTLFRGVDALPPGSVWSGDARTGQTSLSRWSSSPTSNLSDDASLLDALAAAVSRRQARDEGVGLAYALSGGLDSSLVLALGARAGGPRPTAYTVRFEGDPLDEYAHAREVAEHVGAHHRVVSLSRRDIADRLPAAVAAGEGPAINAHLVGKWSLARAVHEDGAKVLLHGEGADEVCLGYPHFLLDAGHVAERSAPRGSPAAALRGLMMPSEGLPSSTTEPVFVGSKRELGGRIERLTTFSNSALSADALLTLTRTEGRARGLDMETHALAESVSLWILLAFEGYILATLGDRVELAHGVEGRPAFLDRSFRALASSIPPAEWMHGGVEKAALRRELRLESLLPVATVERRKQPFVGPPVVAEPGPVAELARAVLLDPNAPGFVDRDAVRSRLDALDHANESERRLWDPPLMWILTTAMMEQEFFA